MMLKWEEVPTNQDSSGERVYRAKISGGWLVKINDMNTPGALCFVPDPQHKWDGNSLP